jgi:hypothetical protein
MTTSLPKSFPWLITHTRPISTNALNEPIAAAAAPSAAAAAAAALALLL